ncbi:MAG: thioredoxin domain-containing protein [Deltaproteobacteria bacterium]|nr:thioredoxin domain-containing protein [Deltaproteobacteria bacterium]
MTTEPSPNRLSHEKSPYLLQHATNPVDWYPWGDEAFTEAARLDKPIFLSIGYSTCHWCHVMAHESFEDPFVADLLNYYFINIKVDREERPDIDVVYMNVCQMLTGRGGWPLTIIMSADKKPFYAATYIPKYNRFGQIGMLELLPKLGEIWQTRRDDINLTAGRIVSALQAEADSAERAEPGISILHAAYDQLFSAFDEINGGFGTKPKFPTPQNLLFLLRFWKRSGDHYALHMVEKTLQAMRSGGIYDHIGFGFHRYAVDQKWLLPHFEKMLYDQAMLAYAYTEAFQATGRTFYAETAEEIFSYIMNRMTSPEGAFYSAEDADSEGQEGKFYLWEWEEISNHLDTADADLFISRFNMDKTGNYTDEMTGKKTGKNILRLTPLSDETSREGAVPDDRKKRLDLARIKLYGIRDQRVHPQKDDKILTDWNGFMIAALAKGGQVLNRQAYIKAAENAAAFILARMRRPDGALLHRFRDGDAGIQGQIDDYAFTVFGLIELYNAAWHAPYLETALELTDGLLANFKDHKNGGFFLTPRDGEEIIVRQKEIFEGAMPSGNSVAIWNMLRLGRMTAKTALLDEAWEAASSFCAAVQQSPGAYTQFMTALDSAFGPSREVVVVGNPARKDTLLMLQAMQSRFLPHVTIVFRPAGEASPAICRIAPFTKDMKSIDGKATAYVCTNHVCEQPTTEIETMMDLIGESIRRP